MDPVSRVRPGRVRYIVTRFVFSLLYRPPRAAGLEPHVAIVMPSFNEEDAIARSLRSLLQLDYPAGKLEIVAVDDGSTDGTLEAMRSVAVWDTRVQVISFPENRGKRAAMAAGIRATDAEIVAFVASDSVLEPDSCGGSCGLRRHRRWARCAATRTC